MSKLPAILGVLFIAIVLLAIYISGGSRRAKKRVPGGLSRVGWALLFLTSGRMPPPPPETQIEREANAEKDRLASERLRKSSGGS